MRLPEKTIELNFCAELTALWAKHGRHVLWFGPTQRQEAKLGFDAATKLSGRLYLFQFKVSRKVLKNRKRRFHLPHKQLQLLQQMCNGAMRRVFYVFPTVGTTADLRTNPRVLPASLLMDVQPLPDPFPQPTGRNGLRRKSECHYADVDERSLIATIHSDPLRAGLLNAEMLAGPDNSESVGSIPEWTFDEFARYMEGLGPKFGKQLQCAVVWPKDNW